MSTAHAAPAAGRRVTLLTDFGTADGYVAAMKGVIAAIDPSVIIDDASHDIPPGDVNAAAWALGAYWRLYPPGTVHVAVIDPGVGSTRRALALKVEQRVFIVPDNGIITDVLLHARLTQAIEIQAAGRSPADVGSSREISATFHGRDVFAPAAGRAASGVPLHELGVQTADPLILPAATLERDGDAITGAVVHVDRFGNLVTSIPATGVSGGHVVIDGGAKVPVLRTYSDVENGEPLALAGSRGFLEVSIRNGSAAEVLRVGRGARVVWLRGSTT
ncbi:MAG: SAM hydrolase/SAM-dependent halogenase family protein [Longimicrobiales bacterium]